MDYILFFFLSREGGNPIKEQCSVAIILVPKLDPMVIIIIWISRKSHLEVSLATSQPVVENEIPPRFHCSEPFKLGK